MQGKYVHVNMGRVPFYSSSAAHVARASRTSPNETVIRPALVRNVTLRGVLQDPKVQKQTLAPGDRVTITRLLKSF